MFCFWDHQRWQAKWLAKGSMPSLWPRYVVVTPLTTRLREFWADNQSEKLLSCDCSQASCLVWCSSIHCLAGISPMNGRLWTQHEKRGRSPEADLCCLRHSHGWPRLPPVVANCQLPPLEGSSKGHRSFSLSEDGPVLKPTSPAGLVWRLARASKPLSRKLQTPNAEPPAPETSRHHRNLAKAFNPSKGQKCSDRWQYRESPQGTFQEKSARVSSSALLLHAQHAAPRSQHRVQLWVVGHAAHDSQLDHRLRGQVPARPGYLGAGEPDGKGEQGDCARLELCRCPVR